MLQSYLSSRTRLFSGSHLSPSVIDIVVLSLSTWRSSDIERSSSSSNPNRVSNLISIHFHVTRSSRLSGRVRIVGAASRSSSGLSLPERSCLLLTLRATSLNVLAPSFTRRIWILIGDENRKAVGQPYCRLRNETESHCRSLPLRKDLRWQDWRLLALFVEPKRRFDCSPDLECDLEKAKVHDVDSCRTDADSMKNREREEKRFRSG